VTHQILTLGNAVQACGKGPHVGVSYNGALSSAFTRMIGVRFSAPPPLANDFLTRVIR